MRKIAVLITIVFCVCKIQSQSELDNYKYVVVPLQYDFLNGENQYRLNTLTKYLFETNGFNAVYDTNDLPKDLFDDKCLGGYADVQKVRGGLFNKKLEISIKDCQGNLIFKSQVGSSKENKYSDAYQEALREAFKSFEGMNYKYIGKENEPQNSHKKENEIKKQTQKVENTLVAESLGSLNYRLKNKEGQVVYTLLFSGKENLYIVKGKDAVVYKLNGNWVIAENSGSDVKIKAIDIQF